MPLKTRAEQLAYLRKYAREQREKRCKVTSLNCECGQLATTIHCGQPSCLRCKEFTLAATSKLKSIHNQDNNL